MTHFLGCGNILTMFREEGKEYPRRRTAERPTPLAGSGACSAGGRCVLERRGQRPAGERRYTLGE